jgi:hypothetical protein
MDHLDQLVHRVLLERLARLARPEPLDRRERREPMVGQLPKSLLGPT